MVYDYLVIGAGSGGIASARRAAMYGAKCAIFERSRLGGTCVNVGCVPKKVMWNAAMMGELLHDMKDYGFDVKPTSFDWAKVKKSRDAYIERLNGIYERNLLNSKVDLIRGHAKIASANTVECNGQIYEGKRILIATGGYPMVPSLEGAEHGITSDGFFELSSLPKKALVVGAGYIAVELVGLLHHLGSDVSLAIRGKGVLRSFDHTITSALMTEMEKSGEENPSGPTKILRDSEVTKVEKDAATGLLTVHFVDGTIMGDLDTLIWAVGRHPRSDWGSDVLGLELQGEKDYVVVDEFQKTSVDNVFAVGDVTGKFELTPVAIAAGRRLSDRVFGGKEGRKLLYENIPTVIFSHPPIGTVGLSEVDAKKEYGEDNIKVYNSSFRNMYHAMTTRKSQTVMKLVCLLPTEKIVGIHIIGASCDEIMQVRGVVPVLLPLTLPCYPRLYDTLSHTRASVSWSAMASPRRRWTTASPSTPPLQRSS